MRPNLIQTYMNNYSVPQDKKDRNLDINYVLSNRTFIKPLPGEGHLVNRNVLEVPVGVAKGLSYDFRSLKKAAKGDANDHELGKINDVGMKIGGLAIAAYLMTRKQTPLKKAMELVGLASFFGTMALWPKIAIQLPTRIIHGFNVKKEYEDSFGREKPFFQDPMYLPWDLVDDKRIHKIGDRMNIAKDMPNRKEFIQEKMRKISVQDNTLWMLTAGIATPIGSALICNACEKPLNKLLTEYTGRKAEKLLSNLGTVYETYRDGSDKEIATLIQANSGRSITPEFTEQLKEILTRDIDDVTARAIKSDIDTCVAAVDGKFVINDSVLNNVVTTIRKEMEGILPEAKIDEVVPKTDVLKSGIEEFMDRDLEDADMKKVLHSIFKKSKKALVSNDIDTPTVQVIIDKLVNGSKNVEKALYSAPAAVLDESMTSKLKMITETLIDFKAKNRVLDEYVYLKLGAAPETVAANTWNDIVDDIPKLFNFTDKEITSIRHDRKLAGQLLRTKLEAITSNPGEYDRVFKSLILNIAKLEKNIAHNDSASSSFGYSNTVNSVFDDAAKTLEEHGFKSTAHRLIGKDGRIDGSLKNIQLSYPENRLLGIRSSLYRLINTMDLFKRISTNENLDALHAGMNKETKEEIIEFVKKLSIEGSTSDYMTKFFAKRNPKPSQVKGDINIANGVVEEEFLNQAVKGGRVEVSYDKTFYQEVMKLLYENKIHPSSEKHLSDGGLADAFKQYRFEFLDSIGGHNYFAKPYHMVEGKTGYGSSYTKFLRVGMSPEQLILGKTREMFNTRQWLKTFGGIGAALLGVTVLAQLFFGRIKTPERAKND